MTSFRVAQLLREGIAAAKIGDGPRAQELLMQVVADDEQNEQAWLWLSGVVEGDEDRQVCLENVLSINPDNSLAKAGLAHLHSRRAAPTTPPPPPPEPEPSAPAAIKVEEADSDDWWDQPFSLETEDDPLSLEVEDETDSLLEERLAAAAAPPAQIKPEQEPSSLASPEPQRPSVPMEEQPPPKKKKKEKRRRRKKRSLARPLLGVAFLLLGLLTAAAAVAALRQVGPFNPTVHDYAQVMRPLLDDYDAWRDGSYGSLVGELNSLCGPGSDGWRNQDVLLVCSRYASLDCTLLAAHCGDDVEEMRERVSDLSVQAQQEGRKLQAVFDDVLPPDDVALAHRRFLTCLQARIDDAGQAGEMARGELLDGPISIPACQMFVNAEDDVRRYIGSR